MNEQQVRNLIQQETYKAAQSSRFNVGSIQRHIHNNIDSPYALQPVISYIGIVNADATYQLLPSGWSVVNSGAGVYTITHNLGTMLYSVVATCIFTSHRDVVQVTGLSTDSFSVNTFFYNPTTLENSAFSFTLTNVNNKSVTPPAYQGTLVQ